MFRNSELLWLIAAVIGGLAFAIALLLAVRHALPKPRTLGDLRLETLEREIGARDLAGLRGVLVSAGVSLDEIGLAPGVARHWIERDYEGRLFGITLNGVPELTSLKRFAELPGLRKLHIEGARLVDLSGFAEPNELWSLAIVDSGLASVEGMAESSELQTLDLSNNRLETLAGLPDLPRLRHLYAKSNSLRTTEGLGGRDRLELIDLCENQLDRLTSLNDLPRLQHLLVSDNRLETLSDLHGMPQLERLVAENNQLVDATALDRFPELKGINLANNRIERWPDVARDLDPHFVRNNPTPVVEPDDLRVMAEERRRSESPHGISASLPPIRSTTRFSRGLRRWAGPRVWCDGGVGRLSGTARVVLRTFEPGGDLGHPAKRPVRIRLSITSGEGRLRAYLNGSDGYPYIETAAGETAAMTGDLFVSDSAGVTFVLEPLDGTARDIHYSVEPAD